MPVVIIIVIILVVVVIVAGVMCRSRKVKTEAITNALFDQRWDPTAEPDEHDLALLKDNLFDLGDTQDVDGNMDPTVEVHEL